METIIFYQKMQSVFILIYIYKKIYLDSLIFCDFFKFYTVFTYFYALDILYKKSHFIYLLIRRLNITFLI